MGKKTGQSADYDKFQHFVWFKRQTCSQMYSSLQRAPLVHFLPKPREEQLDSAPPHERKKSRRYQDAKVFIEPHSRRPGGKKQKD